MYENLWGSFAAAPVYKKPYFFFYKSCKIPSNGSTSRVLGFKASGKLSLICCCWDCYMCCTLPDGSKLMIFSGIASYYGDTCIKMLNYYNLRWPLCRLQWGSYIERGYQLLYRCCILLQLYRHMELVTASREWYLSPSTSCTQLCSGGEENVPVWWTHYRRGFRCLVLSGHWWDITRL